MEMISEFRFHLAFSNPILKLFLFVCYMYIFLVRPVLNIKPFQIQGFYLLSENILMPDISHIVQQKNSYFKSKVFFFRKKSDCFVAFEFRLAT